MSHESSAQLVQRLVDAVLQLTLSVRSRRGVLANEVAQLREVLVACRDDWAGSASIPRRAVNALIDLQPSLLASADLYDDTTRTVVVDLAIELGDLVRDAVAI
jgi:hypothetical protein